jgi:hypothetical protein
MVKKSKSKNKSNGLNTMRISQNERGLVVNESGFIAAGIINVVFGVILTLLALRLVLRLLGADPDSGLVDFVYRTSQPLVAPFFGVFDAQAELSGSGLEVATLIALLVYGLIGGLLARVLMTNRHA